MKTLCLIFTRIHQYFRNNKLVFILFLIGSVTCSLIFIYFYGNVISLKSLSGSNEFIFRQFSISFHSESPLSSLTKNQQEVLQKYPLESFLKDSRLDPELLESEDISSAFRKEVDFQNCFIVRTDLVNLSLYPGGGRNVFYEEEEGKNLVILPSYFLQEPEIPPFLKIAGEEYEIIGIHTNDNALYIPATTFEKNKFPISSISIILKNQLSSQENIDYLNILSSAFPNAQIEHPQEMIEILREQTPSQMLIVAIIYLLSLLSFMFLIKFLIDSCSAEDIIYSLVGAKKSTIIKIITLQNLVLVLFSGFLGIIIHLIFRNSFFESINLFPDIHYNILDYLIILLMMLVLSFLVQIPFLIDYYRHSLISLKQKYIMGD